MDGGANPTSSWFRGVIEPVILKVISQLKSFPCILARKMPNTSTIICRQESQNTLRIIRTRGNLMGQRCKSLFQPAKIQPSRMAQYRQILWAVYGPLSHPKIVHFPSLCFILTVYTRAQTQFLVRPTVKNCFTLCVLIS